MIIKYCTKTIKKEKKNHSLTGTTEELEWESECTAQGLPYAGVRLLAGIQFVLLKNHGYLYPLLVLRLFLNTLW